MESITVETLLALLLVVVAALVAWWLRGRRCRQEKAAVNSGWQRQIDAQQSENQRVVARKAVLRGQLAEQAAAQQQQKRELQRRTKELDTAVQQHQKLQREIQTIRGSLEDALNVRNAAAEADDKATRANSETELLLEKKDLKISHLKRELGRWQDRVPPLVERYRERDACATELELELATARERIAQLETGPATTETRIEPVEPEAMLNLNASNDQYNDTLTLDAGDDRLPGVARDNLKRIKGIGPAIEKTLNRLGIYRFQQLAELSPGEIDRVAGELRGFHSRIQREDWIGQAASLHQAQPPA